jgi:hypothetical protein
LFVHLGDQMNDHIKSGDLVLYTVEYVFGSYDGKVYVTASADDEEEYIISLAKKKLKNLSSLPMASTSYKIVASQKVT